MPDDVGADCQGDADCIAAEQACEDQFNTDVTTCQTQAAKDQQDCSDTLTATLAECDKLPGQQGQECATNAQLVYDQCQGTAKTNEDQCLEAAQANKTFCFSRAAYNFLNSTRNSGKKRKPGTGDCAPCALPDCSSFVTGYQQTLANIDALIKSYQATGTPSPDELVTQIEAVISS